MKYRKLRIAWSVICGITCVLLIGLWARSYRWGSTLQGVIGSQRVQFTSGKGELEVMIFPNVQSPNFPSRAWTLTNNAARFDGWSVWHIGKLAPNGMEVAVPYWLFILISAAVAAATWFPLPTRFSLLSLLTATTIFAVLLLCWIMGLAAVRKSGLQTEEIKLGVSQIQIRFTFPENWTQFLIRLRTFEMFGLGWQATQRQLFVTIPYWLPVSIALVPAVVVWRWWPHRFSFRTLLIVITLAALGLWTVVAMNQ